MTRPWPRDRRAPLPPVPEWHGETEDRIASPGGNWCTPAERDDFDTTPDYEETLAFIYALADASPLIRARTYGRTVEGRPLTLVIASSDHDMADAEKRSKSRARVLVQCGIHPGEIDGKDAGLMLLRDIAAGDREALLNECDLYFVPVVNPDGHERRSLFSRPNQRGPREQGWRASAQGLNLNRDFVKAESPEIRAMLTLFNTIDPDLFVDIHVTDGLDYQYDITFGFQDAPYTASPAINRWLEACYRPFVSADMTAVGHLPGPLILAMDDRRPELGLALPAFPPRFSHSYGDLRHLPSVLVENHSLKPVRQRVLGTLALLEATMRVASANVGDLRAAIEVDRRRREPAPVLTWLAAADPVRETLFHPIASEFYRSPASGAEEVRWLGTPLPPVCTPVHGSTPGLRIARPAGYWVPVSEPEVIERLSRQGIRMDVLAEARTAEVAMIRLDRIVLAPRVSERRVGVGADCTRVERRQRRFAAGSAYVPTDQPMGDLAIHMLEPACADSLFAQGFVTGCLDQVEYMEAYVIAPMADAMLAEDPELVAEFEAALDADPAFAADPVARLKWFYLRSPYQDDDYLLYPIARAIAP
ncbi:Zinc carboxypeptidase [Sphingomonas gellani]|uniref:Zinc carboxypeptidase n=1 Tax=Sphingomonas gellani TaxID=1166340 RepID=A0A1H8GWA7_9SPHN|nr:M14 family metallopeptidase [Sphingomonas gellani]SEN48100.1 Zinc carboxypeptidase [Sphingomonas gellani]